MKNGSFTGKSGGLEDYSDVRVLAAEDRWFERGVKEAIYVNLERPSLNRGDNLWPSSHPLNSAVLSSLPKQLNTHFLPPGPVFAALSQETTWAEEKRTNDPHEYWLSQRFSGGPKDSDIQSSPVGINDSENIHLDTGDYSLQLPASCHDHTESLGSRWFQER